MLRLFAALAIPPEIGEGLIRRQHGLPNANWRPPEAFHVTLRFFGDVREDLAADLDDALTGLSSPALDLELGGVGAFSEGDDLHAVWAGVVANPNLNRLAKAIETAARRVGLIPDQRAYRPHLTLAYLRRPDPASVGQWIAANNLLGSPAFKLDSFGLYSSRLSQAGSRYRLERSYRLQAG